MIVVNNVRYKLTSTDVGDTKSFLYTMIVLATDKPQCVVHMVYMKRLMKNKNFRILVRSPFVLQFGLSDCENEHDVETTLQHDKNENRN